MKSLSPIWSRSRQVWRNCSSQSAKHPRNSVASLLQTKFLSTHTDKDEENKVNWLNPLTFGPICNSLSSVMKDNSNDLTENRRMPKKMSAASVAATAALVTTAGGYSLSPTMVTVISNAPLAAFAFVQASGIVSLCVFFFFFKFTSLHPNCTNKNQNDVQCNQNFK